MTLSALIPQRRPRSELIEDARIRAGAYAVAGALVFYWIVARLWAVPFGILVKGAVIGGLYSMIAVGIALVYRANRIINFAQGDMGGVPASLAVLLIAVSGWPYLAAIAAGLVGRVPLSAGVVGLRIGSALGGSVLMHAPAAAVVGQMARMPTIVVASVMLGVVEQAAVWHNGNTDMVDLTIFLVVLAALLLRRREFTSRIQEAATSTWAALREVRPVPPELARLPEIVWARRAVLAAVLGLVLALPAMLDEAKIDLVTFLAAYLIVALSLLVLSGWAGQISLGQFAFVATGSTVGAWLTLHWHMDVLLVMVVAGSVGAVVAVAIGIPALRIRGLFLAAATLAFTFAANAYFLNGSHFSWITSQFTTVPRLPVFGLVSLDPATRFSYLSYP